MQHSVTFTTQDPSLIFLSTGQFMDLQKVHVENDMNLTVKIFNGDRGFKVMDKSKEVSIIPLSQRFLIFLKLSNEHINNLCNEPKMC